MRIIISSQEESEAHRDITSHWKLELVPGPQGDIMHCLNMQFFGLMLHVPCLALPLFPNWEKGKSKHQIWEITSLKCLHGEHISFNTYKEQVWDFPGGAVVKNPPANAGDKGSIPGPGRSHMPRSN